jgi:hypothetical protein
LLKERDRQIEKLVEAMKQQKEKVGTAVATKQVHDKIASLSLETDRLQKQVQWQEQMLLDREGKLDLLEQQNK